MKRINTAEVFYREQLTLLGIITVILFAAAFLPFCGSIGKLGGDDLGVVIFALAVCFGPLFVIMGIYLARYIHYRNVELTDIQTVKLERVYTKRMSYTMGFVIDVTYNGRVHRGAQTSAVFMTRNMLGSLAVDNYSGMSAEVGYDEKKDEWIVLI